MWVAIGSGQRGGDTLTGNWWITAPALVAALGFVGAFVVGTITIIRDRERSVAVLVITTFGALVTLFLLGEVTNPH